MMNIISLCLLGLVPMANHEAYALESPQALSSLNHNNQTMMDGLNVTSDIDLAVGIDNSAEMMEPMAMDDSSSPFVGAATDQSTKSYSIAEIVSAANVATMDFRSGMSLKFTHFTQSTHALCKSTAHAYSTKLKYLVSPKPKPVTLESLAKEAVARTLWEYQRVHDWFVSMFWPAPPPPSFWEKPTTVTYQQIKVTISGLFGPSPPLPPRTFGSIASDWWWKVLTSQDRWYLVIIAVYVFCAFFVLPVTVTLKDVSKLLFPSAERDSNREQQEEARRANQEQEEEQQARANQQQEEQEQQARANQGQLPEPTMSEIIYISRALFVMGLSNASFADCQNMADELKVVKSRFHDLARRTHPDKGGKAKDFRLIKACRDFLKKIVEERNVPTFTAYGQ